MKKKSQIVSNQDPLEDSPKFLDIESSVFTIVGKDFYLGREKIPEVLLSVLKDDAETIKNSRLWEVIQASSTNEAYRWALDQSTDFELVQSAKMLKHWVFFMTNLVHLLSKEK